MEQGFFHPDRGYWQAIAGNVDDLLPSYPDGTISVPLKPGPGYEWQDDAWVYSPPSETVPDRVTARQFKLQLLADDLIDGVEAWVAAQDRSVQIAYESSGTFARSEPMMEAGFAALGFTKERVDAFFIAAAEI